MIDKNLVDTTDKGIYNLKHDAIEEVRITTNKLTMYDNGYNERPSSYMLRLKGEKRWRRAYLTPIGNVSVMYIKVKYYNHIYCEVAVDEALNNA